MTTSPKSNPERIVPRGIFVLPSLLTLSALFSGFFAIIYSFNTMVRDLQTFEVAGLAIIIATFLDGLDGRIARLLKAESAFGLQFDSIADMVSFGVAPAVVVYASSLHDLQRWGWMGAFFYVACAGIRLARFNVLTNQTEASRKYFKGLSSPVAAGGIALTVLLDVPRKEPSFQIAILIFTLFLALLMVSNVRFRSFKKMDFARRFPVRTLMLFVGLFVLVVSFQQYALLGMFLVYMVWGLSEELVLFLRRRRSDPTHPLIPFGDKNEPEDSIV